MCACSRTLTQLQKFFTNPLLILLGTNVRVCECFTIQTLVTDNVDRDFYIYGNSTRTLVEFFLDSYFPVVSKYITECIHIK